MKIPNVIKRQKPYHLFIFAILLGFNRVGFGMLPTLEHETQLTVFADFFSFFAMWYLFAWGIVLVIKQVNREEKKEEERRWVVGRGFNDE